MSGSLGMLMQLRSKNSFKSFTITVCIASIVLLCFGCSSQGTKANVLPPNVQYMADTMLSKKRRALISEMDSLCEMRFAELVQRKVDSLVRIERTQIENIIGNE